MRRWGWFVVWMGIASLSVLGAAQPEVRVELTGRVGGAASCRQLSESHWACRMVAGSSATLTLTATANPPEHPVTIEGWGVPPWVAFQPASAPGVVTTVAAISPPECEAGKAVLLVFTATAGGVTVELQMQLEITSGESSETVPGGEEGDRGLEFPTPFLPGISTFVLGDVLDCESGRPIEPGLVSTEFVFASGASAPYDLEELERVVVRAPGYREAEITEFEPFTIDLFFFRITVLTPKETGICLIPSGPRALTAVQPVGACVAKITTVLRDPQTVFHWAAEGEFSWYEVLVYDNPCGQYPPPVDTPTPTPTPTPSSTPTPTPAPTPSPPSGQPVATTAGVWEPLWEKLTPAQRDELAGRGLSGWGWVKAARELLGETGEPVPPEALVEEADGVLLPDTPLLGRFGPLSGETKATTLPLSMLLEPGQAFIWQVLGVYETSEGTAGALLTAPQCVRYQPVDATTGEVVPVVSCPICSPLGAVWDCEPTIQIVRPLTIFPVASRMNPDERIAVSVLAADSDLLLWECECLEKTRRKIGTYPERVHYSWQLSGHGQLVDAFENSAIYELPGDLDPGQQVTATLTVTISAPRGGDASIDGRVILTITAGAEGCDDYTVSANIIQPQPKSCPPPIAEIGRDCIAVLKYGKADGPIAGAVQLYSMAYVGEPILLKATHTDTDELAIQCERTICVELPEVDVPLPDPLAFAWDDQGGGGTFPLGNTGRCVVYVPPKKSDVTIRCVPSDLIVRDPEVRETKSQPIAEIVIDLTLCDRDWLPEKDNTTTLTARVYELRNGQCTFPGPARRITFDLTDVSSEVGYCVNRGASKENDLLFSEAPLGAAYHLCGDTTRESRTPTYFTRATTKRRTAEAAVIVSSEDYGSYGTVEARAFHAQPIAPREPEAAATCRLGANAVDVPRDDLPSGGNDIADAWDALFPNHQAKGDDEDRSVNNPHRGDGLTRYEEYRGVDVDDDGKISFTRSRGDEEELESPQNERLSPNLKDLFLTTAKAADLPNLKVGKAFSISRVVVHPFRGSDDRGIDVLVIDITAGTPTGRHFTANPLEARTDLDGHLNKIYTPFNAPIASVPLWTVDWMGGSTVGTATAYGEPKLFNRSIDSYFSQFPYVDGGTFQQAPVGTANRNTWNGAPNGVLDPRLMIEDHNDNGVCDPVEQDGNYDNGDATLDGDHLRLAFGGAAAQNFLSRDWAAGGTATGSFNVFNRNGDAQVETGEGSYTRAQVDVQIITHELGHALGVGAQNTLLYNVGRLLLNQNVIFDAAGHCNDATCVMFRRNDNYTRQDHLCPHCQSVLRIHNN